VFSLAVSRSVTLSRALTHAHIYIFTCLLTHILPLFHPLTQSIHCVPAHSLCLCVSVSLSFSHYFSSAPLSSLLLARLCCLWRRVRTRRRSALIIHVALRLRDGNKVFGSGLEKRHQDRDEWRKYGMFTHRSLTHALILSLFLSRNRVTSRRHSRSVAVCCSVLQCVAVCCSVLLSRRHSIPRKKERENECVCE